MHWSNFQIEVLTITRASSRKSFIFCLKWKLDDSCQARESTLRLFRTTWTTCNSCQTLVRFGCGSCRGFSNSLPTWIYLIGGSDDNANLNSRKTLIRSFVFKILWTILFYPFCYDGAFSLTLPPPARTSPENVSSRFCDHSSLFHVDWRLFSY